jgi:hypothetical protein
MDLMIRLTFEFASIKKNRREKWNFDCILMFHLKISLASWKIQIIFSSMLWFYKSKICSQKKSNYEPTALGNQT